ncbi:ATP-binding protein [Streptomyces sp. NPDC005500]|uniref:ATP-binding protein n=1 Tax=Streptomyces sp. NPDC005500 TaxID=3155007 RepID=UPI0033AFB448
MTNIEVDERACDATLGAWVDAFDGLPAGNVIEIVGIRGIQDLALNHDETAASVARSSTRRVLIAWGMSEDVLDEVLLVVSELVTNAVEHALPPISLHLDRQAAPATVHVEVSDGGPAAVPGPWVGSCAPEEHGRGTQIVACLAADHGIRVHQDGTTRWADLRSAE